jgi:hypothetical protein
MVGLDVAVVVILNCQSLPWAQKIRSLSNILLHNIWPMKSRYPTSSNYPTLEPPELSNLNAGSLFKLLAKS